MSAPIPHYIDVSTKFVVVRVCSWRVTRDYLIFRSFTLIQFTLPQTGNVNRTDYLHIILKGNTFDNEDHEMLAMLAMLTNQGITLSVFSR